MQQNGDAAEQRAAEQRAAENAQLKPKRRKRKEQAATSSSNSGWLRPASGYISSPFGYRTHPVTGARGSFHAGVDIAGSGSIRAARSGRVTAASYSGSYGYRVIVDHGNGYSTLYAHMKSNLSVSVGQSVSQGQQLGIMGTTGRSTGVHLHFEVRKNGSAVNPMNYIR
ncbi:MAG: M23 family metallopeptidase [Alkalibacterium sp.]|nr:M23 family metallopeptidase [Alkalibacterium sp.]